MGDVIPFGKRKQNIKNKSKETLINSCSSS